MRCPFCSGPDTRVLDSRPTEDGAVVRRRRECPACGGRFTTREKVETSPFVVVKKDGRREGFNPDKVLRGLITACEKRPVQRAQLERIVVDVERELRARYDREVPSKDIGELVIARLRDVDQVAYVRFASVYRQFEDLQRFKVELERLLNGGRGGAAGSGPAGEPQG
jgi:transcriptional repressor NrdR